MSTARIAVELTSPSWGTGTDAVAVAEVARAPGGKGAGGPPVRLPLGVNGAPQEAALEEGDYIVRVFMPSGDVQAERVSLRAGALEQLRFELAPSPHEWLGLATSLGVVQTLPRRNEARALEGALTGQMTTVWRKDGRLGAFPSVPFPLPGEDDPAKTLARREVAEHAVQDIERNTVALERIRGEDRVQGIEGWRWIVRLDPKRPWPAERLSKRELALWWAGSPVQGPQPLKIEVADKCNARLVAPGPPPNASIGMSADRAFVALRDPTGNGFYAVYPEGWASTTQSRVGYMVRASVLMTVVVDTAMNSAGSLGSAIRWRCAPEVDDVEAMSLLGFLNAGQAEAGQIMLQRARNWLFGKTINPVAAAAGAYMLLLNGEDANARLSPAWRSWVSNLYNWFPALPDGAIAMAQMALAHGETGRGDEIDIEKLRGYALEAVRRGLPYLGCGVRILTDILVALQGDDESVGRTGPAAEDTRRVLALVRQLGRITAPGEFFTVLRLGDDLP